MKKYVLSAVVASLLAPLAYAMDEGAAPAVEVEVPAVEVPAVEVPAVEEVAVDPALVEEVTVEVIPVGGEELQSLPVEEVPVEVTTLEVEVGVEEPKPEVCPGPDPILLGLPEFVEADPVTTEELPMKGEVVQIEEQAFLVDDHGHLIEDGSGGALHGVTTFDENGESTLPCPHLPVEGDAVELNLIDLAVDGGLPVDENTPRIAVCYFGDVFTEPVEGEPVDPNLIDLASQSGFPVDENAKPLEGEGIDLSFQGGVSNSVDDNGNPDVFYFAPATRGDLPQNAPVGGGGAVEATEVETTTVEDSPVRSLHSEIQPHYRGAITERGPEALAASASGLLADTDTDTNASISSSTDAPQLLNDEQRGAVRGLRSDEEPVKPRSGISRLLSKFRKPKSEVIQASASATTDTVLSSKLAEVDRLRDTALRTGDQKMLAKADKLEQELRAKSGQATQIPTRTK